MDEGQCFQCISANQPRETEARPADYLKNPPQTPPRSCRKPFAKLNEFPGYRPNTQQRRRYMFLLFEEWLRWKNFAVN
ncbi:uncharacterized protein FSUBG_5918 [Fusarium subglutinans]|uniref:Uncharacterized protein n=1 Tax=Gibberella subglutinans TaxID=42677 RepID=A0A8H5Q023_GIBSU|nr:uncharacterized protein FSUBG_5918 [Fusarium subglutinans]KAF5606521.1 hypothetical protein FSUBG_5918 [Fusarium subglutinans]